MAGMAGPVHLFSCIALASHVERIDFPGNRESSQMVCSLLFTRTVQII